ERTSLSYTTAFNHTVNWAYDSALRVSERYIDSSANWTDSKFHYDGDSALSSVNVQADTFNVYRTSDGMLQCTTVGSVCEMYAYNSYGELTEQKAVNASCNSSCNASGNVLLDIVYDHSTDPLGRIRSKNETIGTSSCNWSYTYGSTLPEALQTASQSGSTYCGPSSLTQGYDADGNLNFG